MNEVNQVKSNEISEDKVKEKVRPYKLFYALAVIFIIYMGFSAFTSYTSFIQYCETYSLEPGAEVFTFIQTLLAAVVPCLTYAASLYGIGILIKNQK